MWEKPYSCFLCMVVKGIFIAAVVVAAKLGNASANGKYIVQFQMSYIFVMCQQMNFKRHIDNAIRSFVNTGYTNKYVITPKQKQKIKWDIGYWISTVNTVDIHVAVMFPTQIMQKGLCTTKLYKLWCIFNHNYTSYNLHSNNWRSYNLYKIITCTQHIYSYMSFLK